MHVRGTGELKHHRNRMDPFGDGKETHKSNPPEKADPLCELDPVATFVGRCLNVLKVPCVEFHKRDPTSMQPSAAARTNQCLR